ncbi:MAG: AAA family ATPase [Nanoarchaeota archaeon]|nr:AAA family ATPase [Nanoarchaeota archaeon]
MIIGLTGKYCCGKGVAVEYLQSKGFVGFSLSDMLREKLKAAGKEVTRDNLITLGNSLRKKQGPGALGKIAMEKISELKKQGKKKFYVDSVRNPLEARELMKDSEFRLIFIDADQLIRFQRMLLRKRENDPETFEEFKKKELRESKGTSKYSQRLNDTIKMVNYTVKNESTVEDLHKQVDKLIKDIQKSIKASASVAKAKS